MGLLRYLSISLFALWCLSEMGITLLSARNCSGVRSAADRGSFLAVWLSTIPPILFAYLIQRQVIFADGFGSFSALLPFLGYLGCFLLACGVVIRLMAVAALKGQFTTKVAIVEKHKIIETGVYKRIRHPAYLGHLLSLLGLGLILGNWLGLTALVALPLAGILYRIQVEERVLLASFGRAYQNYASRMKRLLPGIW